MKRVALVTGGTRGIGLGIARCLAHEDYDLALCGTRAGSAVADALAELRELGATVRYFQADIGEREARTRLVEQIREQIGHLHLLVNNAGVGPGAQRHP